MSRPPRSLRARYERQVAGSGDPAERWYNWVIRLRDAGRLCGTVQATVRDGDVVDEADPGRTAAANAISQAAGQAKVRSGDDPPADRAKVRSADDPPGGQLVAEVAWVVGVPWQGQGIATEAARALLGWLAQLPVLRVIAHIHPGHQASAAVAAACGLAPTGQWQDGEIRWELTMQS